MGTKGFDNPDSLVSTVVRIFIGYLYGYGLSNFAVSPLLQHDLLCLSITYKNIRLETENFCFHTNPVDLKESLYDLAFEVSYECLCGEDTA